MSFKFLGKKPPVKTGSSEDSEREYEYACAVHFRGALLEAAALLESDEYPKEWEVDLMDYSDFIEKVTKMLRVSAGVEKT